MISLHNKFLRVMMLISQQHDVINYKETISESFNLFPASRPALLDMFRDVILDKYLPAIINQRSKISSDLEDVIKLFLFEINSLLDKELNNPDYANTDCNSKSSNLSGHGFVGGVCYWILGLFGTMFLKYNLSLSLSDISPGGSDCVPKWQLNPVILNLMDILTKTLKSGISGEESVSLLIKSIAQNRVNLSWVIKYIGGSSKFSGKSDEIVSKLVNTIISVNDREDKIVDRINSCHLQSSIYLLCQLGTSHLHYLQESLSKLIIEIINNRNNKNMNTQNLIYFILMLAAGGGVGGSGSEEESKLDLSQTILIILSDLFIKSNPFMKITPKQLESFLIQQQFPSNILRGFYYMIINVILNSIAPEIHQILEYIEYHSHFHSHTIKTNQSCCSVEFSRICSIISKSIASRLLIQTHSTNISLNTPNSRSPPIALAGYIGNRAEYWIERLLTTGSTVAAQFLTASTMAEFFYVGEDTLVGILENLGDAGTSGTALTAAYRKCLVLFPRMLDEFEINDDQILYRVLLRVLSNAQISTKQRQIHLLRTLLILVRRESKLESERRRISRNLSKHVDLILLVAAKTENPLSTPPSLLSSPQFTIIQLTCTLLQSIDVISDEIYSLPSSNPFISSSNHDNRFQPTPIFVSTRSVKCLSNIINKLLHNINNHKVIPILRQYIDLLINYARTTFSMHNIATLQIILRHYIQFYNLDSNNNSMLRKTLKRGWFQCCLVTESPPIESNRGQLKMLSSTGGLRTAATPGSMINMIQSQQFMLQQQYWSYIIFSFCYFFTLNNTQPQLHSQPETQDQDINTNIYSILHFTLRQLLTPGYHIYISPDTNIMPKDLNIIIQHCRRYNQTPLVWSLLRFCCSQTATNHDHHETIAGLLIGCRHLWSPSDCPKVKLIRNIEIDSNIFVSEAKDPIIMKAQMNYELIDSRSQLFYTTIRLFECISYSLPLAEQLGLLLSYLSAPEIQTVLTHLTYFWMLPNNGQAVAMAGNETNMIQMHDSDIAMVIDEDIAISGNNDSSAVSEGVNNSTNNSNINVTNGIASNSASAIVFSWDTLLPSLVHARIHFRALYDQFSRLLATSTSASPLHQTNIPPVTQTVCPQATPKVHPICPAISNIPLPSD